jgi:hypothetical protein
MPTQLQPTSRNRAGSPAVRTGSRSRHRSTSQGRPVAPSIGAAAGQPFTLEQELVPFGHWVGNPVWVPPKGCSHELANSMLRSGGLLTSQSERWASVVDEHRTKFTQVREFQLHRASIRLPEGRVFVSVTERANFDQITDRIPDCVRTRLDEFLEGPGRQPGVKVYYLKPLCVEAGDQLIFTTREELGQAIDQIRNEVFTEYRQMVLAYRTRRALLAMADLAIAGPRYLVTSMRQRAQRKLDAYQAKLEYNRRKLALKAANLHRRCRTDGCTFDDMLALTNPLERNDVIEQYSIERQLSQAKRKQLIQMTSVTLPWFLAIPLTAYYVASVATSITATLAPPVMLCDPAFVAEMPNSRGVVLKIGHFDEINGVTHVEI